MSNHDKQDYTFDLRVAYLVTNYGPEALTVAREHIEQYRANNDWPKEQEWLNIYSQILTMSGESSPNTYLN